jgi:hypothetical protein
MTGAKTTKPATSGKGDYDRRITDRRNRERRYAERSVLSPVFWVDMIAQQWPLWLGFGLLAAAFVVHIIRHP